MLFSFKSFTASEKATLKRHLKERAFSKNAVIFKEGDTADALYIVSTGSAKLVHRNSIDGLDDEIIKVIQEGNFLGEETFLTEGSQFMTTAVAMEDSRLLKLDQPSMAAIMMNSVSTATKLLLEISKNYRDALLSKERTGSIISFYSPASGLGTTTMAVNSALAIKKEGPKAEWPLLILICSSVMPTCFST